MECTQPILLGHGENVEAGEKELNTDLPHTCAKITTLFDNILLNVKEMEKRARKCQNLWAYVYSTTIFDFRFLYSIHPVRCNPMHCNATRYVKLWNIGICIYLRVANMPCACVRASVYNEYGGSNTMASFAYIFYNSIIEVFWYIFYSLTNIHSSPDF